MARRLSVAGNKSQAVASLDRPKEKGPPRWGFCGDPLRRERRVICEIRLLSRKPADKSPASGGKSGFSFDRLN